MRQLTSLFVSVGVLAAPAFAATNFIFIADSSNNVVRLVNGSSGVITTFAGNGIGSFGGDGGPATSATLWNPTGVAVDSAGNVLIADQRNNRIRKVSAGVITTVAGSGAVGYGGDGGSATSAALYYPTGVTLDGAGDIFISDSDNQRVREVSGGIITTIMGTGFGGFSCGTGTATSLALNHPTGVSVDSINEIFIADYGDSCVRVLNTGGTDYTNIGSGTPGYGGDGGSINNPGVDLYNPAGLVANASLGEVYIADYGNHRIRAVTYTGTISTFAGTGVPGYSGDGGPATSARLYNPAGVALYVGTAP